MQFLEDLEFELMEVHGVDSTCELEGLVVVIEVILEFGRQQYSCEDHLVDVEVVQTEVRHLHVVTVDVDNCDHQALGGKLGVLVQSPQEVLKADAWNGRRVEDGFARSPLLID